MPITPEDRLRVLQELMGPEAGKINEEDAKGVTDEDESV